jgi:hypothetical protein
MSVKDNARSQRNLDSILSRQHPEYRLVSLLQRGGWRVKLRLRVVPREGTWYTFVGGWDSALVWRLNDEASRLTDDSSIADNFWEQLYTDQFGRQLSLLVDQDKTVKEVTTRALRKLALQKPALRNIASLNLALLNSKFNPIWRRHFESSLIQLPTQRTLDENRTLREEGLEDEDLLGLVIVYPADYALCMSAVPSGADLFATIYSSDGTPPNAIDPLAVQVAKYEPERTKRVARIWGALLYTDEDEELASYVREHFLSLNQLSGELFHIFVIEESEDLKGVQNFWKRKLAEQRLITWGVMGWLATKPYDPSEAYRVAQKLGVEEDQIPCLVLFDRVDRQEKLIFPVPDVSPSFFRKLFASLRRAAEGNEYSTKPETTRTEPLWEEYGFLEDATPAAFEAIAAHYERIRESLELVKESGARSQYSLYGPTVFVNHPQGLVSLARFQEGHNGREGTDVTSRYEFHGEQTTFIERPINTTIQDFQNTYISGEEGATKEALTQLQELVKLILQSEQLNDDTKNDAVSAVHAVAEQVKDQKGSKLTLKGTLEAIRDVVTQAADVAGPAVAIIASVLKLVGLA